ncbi:MAG: hypothetical protein Q9159_007497 [Coniocarpon cinnabarinum]
MALRGERFQVDLPDALQDLEDAPHEQQEHASQHADPIAPVIPVKDILEREVGSLKPSAAPAQRVHPNGFPEHKNRFNVSKFKQQRQGKSDPLDRAAGYVEQQSMPLEAEAEKESASIDRENQQKLASMSDEEIQKERAELLGHLGPSLVQRFLKHSTVDEPRGVLNEHKHTELKENSTSHASLDSSEEEVPRHRIGFADGNATAKTSPAEDSTTGPAVNEAETETVQSMHFPQPDQPPSLDPSSASFLDDLHNKYFASLPSDPSKLAWMQQPSSDASYNANSTTVQTSDLRFDFSGAIITPRQAERISVTEGLHHHEDAPQSAGYTLPELARLAHSAVPSQRCIAFQTLGRVLFRLGIGQFGAFEDTIPHGLWLVIRDGAVIEKLYQEVKEARHMSSKAYAAEAIWLWQRGGGRHMGQLVAE